MRTAISRHIARVLKHLYINPLERCNLRCEICYTRKTSPILTKDQIEEFIRRYQKTYPLDSVTFCGGEVFTLPYFTNLVNALTKQGIFVQTITNGTIDRLSEFADPNSLNMIVSVDGLRAYHDKNRGEGNFDTSMAFLTKAKHLGFHTEIFSIVTKQNFKKINAFEKYIQKELGKDISVIYHPRKPPAYLLHHPVSNIFGKVEGFDFLDKSEMLSLFKERNTFPPKKLGCFQIALASDGRVYGCCEGVSPIGMIGDPVGVLGNCLTKRLAFWEKMHTLKTCLGCSSPEFVCGIKEYLTLLEG